MATDDSERLIRIDEQVAHVARAVEDLRGTDAARSIRLETHDREIALLKQAQESEQRYQALKNESFTTRLDDHERRWVNNEAEHAATMSLISEMRDTITAARGGGRVVYWLLGIGTTIGVGWVLSLIRGG